MSIRTGITAASLALAFGIALSLPAHADPAGDALAAGVAGGMFGFMAGAAGASSDEPAHHHHHHYTSDYEQHVQDCEDAYGWRYDPDTDLVKVHHHFMPCD